MEADGIRLRSPNSNMTLDSQDWLHLQSWRERVSGKHILLPRPNASDLQGFPSVIKFVNQFKTLHCSVRTWTKDTPKAHQTRPMRARMIKSPVHPCRRTWIRCLRDLCKALPCLAADQNDPREPVPSSEICSMLQKQSAEKYPGILENVTKR